MKSKIAVRIVCIVLAVAMLASVFMVVLQTITASAATTTVTETSPTSPVSLKNTGYINANSVALYAGAGSKYSIITTVSKNTNVTLISSKLYNSEWYNVQLPSGQTGYIQKSYITFTATDIVEPTTTATTIKLSSSSETIYVGNQYALTATVSGSGSVSWTSSSTSVATVNSNGVVTAKSSGSTTIKASVGSVSASCKITVKSGSSINISKTSISSLSKLKSVYLTSSTSGVKWKSSNTSIATVSDGVVDTKAEGYVTISAYTSSGAATCLINVTSADSIQFVFASPNSAPKNSTVTFKAITDTTRTAVRFVVSKGSTSYTIDATSKEKDGDNYIWFAKQSLPTSGEWSIKSYSKTGGTDYTATSGNGEGTVFVTNSTDTTTTVEGERRASDSVIALIANYEGFLSSVTADSITSDPTLGYGKVILSNEEFYNNLTKNEAYAYLCQTVNSGGYTTKTNQFLTENNIKFNQNQFDALVCFTYNLGAYVIYNDSDLQNVLLDTGTTTPGTIKAGASGYVNASYVNLRSGAGTGYSILTTMDQNTKFTFVDGTLYNSNWYKIKLSSGTTGYIYSSYASASATSSTRDLDNVSKTSFVNNFFAYHHAGGSCYWGLLYRKIDEGEMFFYADYTRDGQYNKKNFSYTCSHDSSVSI